MFRGDGISIGKRICYKIQMFPAILPEVRPIRVIYRSHICKFIYSSKCICNPQINTHRAFSVMHGDAPVGPNFHCPHARSCSLPQRPDGGKGQLCGILIRALVISLLRTAALQSVELFLRARRWHEPRGDELCSCQTSSNRDTHRTKVQIDGLGKM